MDDTVSQFKDAIRAAGLEPPDDIVPGKFDRFPGKGKRKDNKAGWCLLYENGLGGCFGDWSTGLKEFWRAEPDRQYSQSEQAAHRRNVEKARKLVAAEQKQRHADAAKEAISIWEGAKPALGDHDYLVKKGIKPHGMRVHENGRLIVPVCIDGKVISLQRIAPDGDKKFLPDGKVAGGYCCLGKTENAKIVCIAEGFATGATIRQATGYPVVIAFNDMNLLRVAKATRKALPKSRIIVCADDDVNTEGNPGVIEAEKAARAIGAKVAVPQFKEPRPQGATDFNDMAAQVGLKAVARVINAAKQPVVVSNTKNDGRLDPPFTKASTPQKVSSALLLINGKEVKSREYDWIIPHWLVRGEIHLLAGVAKKGKTAIALKLAALITRGDVLAEKYACREGKVLIWSGEDDLERTIVPRLKAMDADMDKIRFIRHLRIIDGKDQEVPFYLDEDLAKLDQALTREKDIRMMVLDPIIGIAANARDGYSAIHIRKAMEPLIAMTRKHGIATLGITHFKKGGYGSVLDRVIGSQAWTAIARVVWVADFLKAEDTHVLCRAHCNIDAPIDNIAYNLTSTDDGILKIEFGREMPGGVEVLEDQGSVEDPERRAASADASDFLLDYLENVPGYRDEWQNIVKAGKEESLSESTLRRVRSNQMAQGKIMRGRVAGERGGKTLWHLAEHDQSDNDK